MWEGPREDFFDQLGTWATVEVEAKQAKVRLPFWADSGTCIHFSMWGQSGAVHGLLIFKLS